MKEINVSRESQNEKMIGYFKQTNFPLHISKIPKAKQMGNFLSL